ncbi:MAG: SGNH/GDSL hydrolase family protein [Bacilli bacterium]
MKKTEILLLGDSIRLFYEPRVRDLLGDEFNVSSPMENCKFTSLTLYTLPTWLSSVPKPDIIHFNNGLWDIAIVHDEDGNFTPLNQYLLNMNRIVRELKKTGAKLIFATTTPTNPLKRIRQKPNISIHKNEDITKYNTAVVELMKSEGVVIDDLFAVVNSNINRYIRKDDLIHPTEEGIEVLAQAVVKCILRIKNK